MSAPAGGRPRRVLVTGAGGFIGSHLAADRRARGDRVVALDLDLRGVAHLAEPGGFELLRGDVADPELQRRALAGVDDVFHLAAAHLSAAIPDAAFERVNVAAVRALVASAARAGVRRFVHCSSVGVYGALLHPPADEDSPCRPGNAYERSKLAGEAVVREAIRDGALPAVVLRPAWVYGPGCPRTRKLFEHVGRGTFVVAGRGDALRHCLYVRDLLDAFDRALRCEAALGQVILVADARPVRVRELVDEVARLCGARPPRSVPLWAVRAAARASEWAFAPLRREPPLSRRSLLFFTGNTAFDTARARRLLGFAPRYDVAAGLAETAAWLAGGAVRPVPLPPPLAA